MPKLHFSRKTVALLVDGHVVVRVRKEDVDNPQPPQEWLPSIADAIRGKEKRDDE